MEGEWEKPSFMSPDEVKVLQEVAAQEDFKGKITVETNPDPTKYPQAKRAPEGKHLVVLRGSSEGLEMPKFFMAFSNMLKAAGENRL